MIREVGAGQTYSTITAALAAAAASDVINIHSGTYTENVSLDDTGLTIQANTGDSPILEGRINVNGQDNTTITGLEFTSWATSVGNYAISSTTACTGLTVSNCTFHDAYGTALQIRNNTQVLIYGCEIYNLLEGGSISGRGISLLGCHSTDGTYANGAIVRDCYIHDNQEDGIDLVGEYFTIEGNRIYNHCAGEALFGNHSDALQIVNVTYDGYSSAKHVIIRGNWIKNATQLVFGQGVDNANKMEDVWVYNNVLWMDAGTVQGYDLDTNTVKLIALYNYNGVNVFNNTLGRCNGPCALFDKTTGVTNTADSLTFQNNICENAIGYGIAVGTAADAVSGGIDYNLYHCPSVYAINWAGATYSTAALFHAAVSAQEANGLDGDSLLNSFPSASLQAGSPAINSGTDLSVDFNTDITGAFRSGSWDMGAYEYGASPAITSGISGIVKLSGKVSLL